MRRGSAIAEVSCIMRYADARAAIVQAEVMSSSPDQNVSLRYGVSNVNDFGNKMQIIIMEISPFAIFKKVMYFITQYKQHKQFT